MKKLFCLLAFILCVTFANAQVINSNSFLETIYAIAEAEGEGKATVATDSQQQKGGGETGAVPVKIKPLDYKELSLAFDQVYAAITQTATKTTIVLPKNKAPASLIANIEKMFKLDLQETSPAYWTTDQALLLLALLNRLPKSFLSCTKDIRRVTSFASIKNVLGYVQMGIPRVNICDSACNKYQFQGVIIHEMTHTFQARNPDVMRRWADTFWSGGIRGRPKLPPPVTLYGCTNAMEDMSEAVRLYWEQPQQLKKKDAKRFNFVKQFVMAGQQLK